MVESVGTSFFTWYMGAPPCNSTTGNWIFRGFNIQHLDSINNNVETLCLFIGFNIWCSFIQHSTKMDNSDKKHRGFAHTPKKVLTISTIEKVKAPKRHAKYRFLSVNQSYSHPPDLIVLTENCMGMHHWYHPWFSITPFYILPFRSVWKRGRPFRPPQQNAF